MQRFLVLLCLLFLNPGMKAQDAKLPFSTGAAFHHGYMLPEYQFINYLVDRPVSAFEVDIYRQTTGMNEWEQLYRYPDYGISIMYSSLGNREAFGEYTALWPWYRIHFIDNPGFSLDYRLGLGLCYVNTVFDPEAKLPGPGHRLTYEYFFQPGNRNPHQAVS